MSVFLAILGILTPLAGLLLWYVKRYCSWNHQIEVLQKKVNEITDEIIALECKCRGHYDSPDGHRLADIKSERMRLNRNIRVLRDNKPKGLFGR